MFMILTFTKIFFDNMKKSIQRFENKKGMLTADELMMVVIYLLWLEFTRQVIFFVLRVKGSDFGKMPVGVSLLNYFWEYFLYR